MQEKITSAPPPLSAPMKNVSPETSQVILTKVLAYLEHVSESEKLHAVLQLARSLQHGQTQERFDAVLSQSLIRQTPTEDLWNKHLLLFQNKKGLFVRLLALRDNLKKQQYPKAAHELAELVDFLVLNENSDIPTPHQEEIDTPLGKFFDAGESTKEGSLGEKALVGYGMRQVLRMKDQGLKPGERKALLKQQLLKLAFAIPPTPLSNAARKLLQNFEMNKDLEAQILEGDPQDLSDLLNQILPSSLRRAFESGTITKSLASATQASEKASSTRKLFSSYKEGVKKQVLEKVGKESTRGQVGSQIAYLLSLIAQLEKLDPNNPALKQYASMIAQIEKDYPNLTNADMQNLNTVLGGLSSEVNALVNNGKMSQAQYVQFLTNMQNFVQGLMQENSNELPQLQAMLSQINAQIANLESVGGDIAEIQAILQELAEGKPVSATDMQKLAAAVQDLLMKYNSLSPQDQQEVNALFNALGSLKNSQGQSFGTIVADALIELWIQQYCQAHQPATVDGLQQYIQAMMAKLGQSNLPGSFYANFMNELGYCTTNPEFPQVPGNAGVFFGNYTTPPNISPNSSFWQQMAGQFNFTPSSVQNALTGLAGVYLYFEKEITEANAQQQAIEQAIANMGTLQNELQNANQLLSNAIMAGSSLPDDFANAILGHYMPQQEAYLQALAELLFFYNAGASMDNGLLQDLMGWGDASNNYNFSNWYNSQGGNTTQQGTQAQINQEENQTTGDITQAQNSLNYIQQQLAQIKQEEADGSLTPAQAQQLTTQLNNEAASITQAITNLQTLLNQLKNTTVNSNGTISQADQTAISGDESMVTKGDPNNNGFGGLQTIYTNITNEQSQWSKVSQQQQIMLQMRMTEIQQEWSVVSTAIQLLNQMYMAPAQAIYK